MGPYHHHTLQRVELMEGSSLFMPDTWTMRRASKEGWWYGDYERGTDLLMEITHIALEEREKPVPLTEQIEIGVTGALTFFEVRGAGKEPTVEQTDRGAVVHSFIDEDDDGRPVRAFHWWTYVTVGDGLSLIHFNLGIPRGKVEEPEYAELVQIFADQARLFYASRREADGKPVLAERRIGNIATVSLPESWIWHEDDGTWWCYDRSSTKPGKLTVHCTDYEVGPNATEDDLRSYIADMLEPFMDRLVKSGERIIHYDVLHDGLVFQTIRDDADESDEDAGPPIRILVWYHIRMRRGTVLNVSFGLMIPLAEVETPHCVKLVEALTPAILSARIE